MRKCARRPVLWAHALACADPAARTGRATGRAAAHARRRGALGGFLHLRRRASGRGLRLRGEPRAGRSARQRRCRIRRGPPGLPVRRPALLPFPILLRFLLVRCTRADAGRGTPGGGSGRLAAPQEDLRTSMRPLLALPCILLACATAEPMATPTPQAGPTRLEASPRQPPPFDAKGFAAIQLSPVECEKGARQLYEMRPDQGWAALVACIERSRWPRGEFTHLELLTRGAWDQELQTRPEAPRVIAKVVALRGGDVEGDIPLVQKSRVPLFTLAAALRQPDVYRGRWVLVRGSLSEIKQDGNKAAAMIAETSLRATAHEVQDGPIRRYDSSYRGSGQAEVSGSSRTSNSNGSSS